MKHILNDLSSDEKNKIREQYEGGMNVDVSKFKKLLETKLGDVKPLVMEELNDKSGDNWPIIYSSLKSVTDVSGNSPKIIPFTYDGKKITSLNWGNHSDTGKKKPWGISVSSDDQRLKFGTQDKNSADVYKTLTTKTPYFDGKYYTNDLTLDYSNPQNVIATVKKIIKGLN